METNIVRGSKEPLVILQQAIIGVLGDSHYFGETEPEFKVGEQAAAALRTALDEAFPDTPVEGLESV